MSPANPGYVIPLRALGMHDAGVDRSAGERPGPLREDQVPRSIVVERRLTNRALAACELVALQPMPIPFEASVNDPMGAQVLVRGLALPLPEAGDPAALVQIVLSWREVLSKSAAKRLRAELASAFAQVQRLPPVADPFPRRPRSGAALDVFNRTKITE